MMNMRTESPRQYSSVLSVVFQESVQHSVLATISFQLEMFSQAITSEGQKFGITSHNCHDNIY
jgi:hypothetical protein